MLNSITLMGRLTADPEDRSTNTVSVVRFAVACQRDFARQGEEKKTDFIDCVAFGKTAEFVKNYFHRGNMIALNGRLQTDTYTTNNGENRKSVNIAVNNVYFGESSNGGNKTYMKTANYTEEEYAPIEISEDEDLPF